MRVRNVDRGERSRVFYPDHVSGTTTEYPSGAFAALRDGHAAEANGSLRPPPPPRGPAVPLPPPYPRPGAPLVAAPPLDAVASDPAASPEAAAEHEAPPELDAATEPAPEPEAAPEPAPVDLAGNKPGKCVTERASQERAMQRAEVGRIRAWRLRHSDAVNEEHSWRSAADGERLVGKRLEKLRRNGFNVLHSLPLAEGGTDIDHLVICPGGVFTLSTKNHPGAS
ncbi:MAG: hypothetical protein RLZ55_819, partial [Actinomycetota bacterium]